jgi:hypothetical protein
VNHDDVEFGMVVKQRLCCARSVMSARHNQFSGVELFDPSCQGEKFLRTRLETNRQSDDLRLARLFGNRLHIIRRIEHCQ